MNGSGWYLFSQLTDPVGDWRRHCQELGNLLMYRKEGHEKYSCPTRAQKGHTSLLFMLKLGAAASPI